MSFTPYNVYEAVQRHRLNLPHWRQWDRTYFITTRLADSIPRPVVEQWNEQRRLWLSHHGADPGTSPAIEELPQEQRNAFHRAFTARFHELLDAGEGKCLLAQPEVAEILSEQMTSGHGTNYRIDAWVIMPNHVHALVEPLGENTLGSILQRWKGAGARKINQLLGQSGKLWQAETFDHIVRSEAQLDHFRRYIARNPEKAGIKSGYMLGLGTRTHLTAEEVLQK